MLLPLYRWILLAYSELKRDGIHRFSDEIADNLAAEALGYATRYYSAGQVGYRCLARATGKHKQCPSCPYYATARCDIGATSGNRTAEQNVTRSQNHCTGAHPSDCETTT